MFSGTFSRFSVVTIVNKLLALRGVLPVWAAMAAYGPSTDRMQMGLAVIERAPEILMNTLLKISFDELMNIRINQYAH